MNSQRALKILGPALVEGLNVLPSHDLLRHSHPHPYPRALPPPLPDGSTTSGDAGGWIYQFGGLVMMVYGWPIAVASTSGVPSSAPSDAGVPSPLGSPTVQKMHSFYNSSPITPKLVITSATLISVLNCEGHEQMIQESICHGILGYEVLVNRGHSYTFRILPYNLELLR
ncbi:hypothetical protein GUJ93_ZPchr0007g5670 [Zizania palustris]|uniref:Uncharacterized protein n=1 Tax=Zizania palustris TaxID=103762 RepID=A0A8J5STU2_ZIZPA|nr:hypothetical protein GUJ93_ZPchr0007g5670 [Zizania palustris]